MNLGVISVRYARALLKAAKAQNNEDEVYSEMKTLYNNFLNVKKLRQIIENPMVQKDKKCSILLSACSDNPSDIIERFLKIVLKADRENVLQLIAASYITLYRELNNIISGKLVTATAVNDDIKNRMKQFVEKNTNAIVEFQTQINLDIIGGFILEYDTYRIDSSIKGKLNSILKQLKE